MCTLRIYDRKALCESKNLIPPGEYHNHWQRYEIVYTKTRAKLADKLVQGEDVETLFKKSLRRLFELLVSSKSRK